MIPRAAREQTLPAVGIGNFHFIQKHLFSTYCVSSTGIGALDIEMIFLKGVYSLLERLLSKSFIHLSNSY